MPGAADFARPASSDNGWVGLPRDGAQHARSPVFSRAGGDPSEPVRTATHTRRGLESPGSNGANRWEAGPVLGLCIKRSDRICGLVGRIAASGAPNQPSEEAHTRCRGMVCVFERPAWSRTGLRVHPGSALRLGRTDREERAPAARPSARGGGRPRVLRAVCHSCPAPGEALDQTP